MGSSPIDQSSRASLIGYAGHGICSTIRQQDTAPFWNVNEAALIGIKRLSSGDPLEFEVVVREGAGETNHRVTMSKDLCSRLTGGQFTPEQCIEASFRFLLDREPKESILRSFDVAVISRYFPEYERELPDYLLSLSGSR
jgi:hypothetical protein